MLPPSAGIPCRGGQSFFAPGQRGTYTNERNYLVLERVNTGWKAAWELPSYVALIQTH